MEKIFNYIDGELCPPQSGGYIDNYDPAIGKVYSLVPDSGDADVEAAVTAARRAFPEWSVLPAAERSRKLLRISQLIEKRLPDLARAECIDNGKPLRRAQTIEIPRAASNFYFFATGLLHFASESHAMENRALNYTLRSPLGVVGCISPWNLPLYLLTWKIAPALAAGNCVVAKPSEITPMTAFLLSGICREAGLPPGVLNIVHGFGHKAGKALVAHPEVPGISFTGGTRTGAEIARTAGPMFKKISLEMGGKNPNIIFADCDYERMLATTIQSSFANQGQICLCGSRIFVEAPLYERFKKDFLERTAALTVGDPLDEDTHQGAIVSRAHYEKILTALDLARREGGAILTGGKARSVDGRCRDGWFIAPTVIEGLSPECRTNQEEIFGPVVTITPFSAEEQVLNWANGTPYGLSATVWTGDLSRAHRVAGRLKTGVVWINCWLVRDLRTPFGGFKDSGVGREGGFEALRFFSEPKNVCLEFPPEPD